MDRDPEEEEVVCRICREDDARPLFYPCKCRGSIKYVHAECLESWLRMSKKVQCEVRACSAKLSCDPGF